MDKSIFVKQMLQPTIVATGREVERLDYKVEVDPKHPGYREEYVVVTYLGGFSRQVCVSGDSLVAIIKDVLKVVG